MLSWAMTRLWNQAERAYRTRILESASIAVPLSMLDVGCDDGAWTEAVRRRIGIPAGQVFGLEIVPERAELARRHGFDVRSADLEERWPFDDESIGFVHANQVIEHVKRLDHFVSEIRRVLVPGGIGLVCTENLASWHNVAALALGWQPFSVTNISNLRPIGNPLALLDRKPNARGESWQHVHVVTLTALRDIFVAHGLAIVDSWGVGYHPLPGKVARAATLLDPRHAHFIAVVVRKSA